MLVSHMAHVGWALQTWHMLSAMPSLEGNISAAD